MKIELSPAGRDVMRGLAGNKAKLLATLCKNGAEVAEIVAFVAQAQLALYERTGAVAPWIGYFARAGETLVGACSFTGMPADGAVEIAYFTIPPYEGRGIASQMAGLLVAIAMAEPDIQSVKIGRAHV